MAQMIRRGERQGPSSPTQLRLEKASRKMLKDAGDLTRRKGEIDRELIDLRISLTDSPVRTIVKK